MHASKMDIRLCSVKDLNTVLNIARSTFIDTFAEFNDPVDFDAYVAQAFSSEQIGKELSEKASSFYLLSHHNEPAGYLKLNFPPAQTDLNEAGSMEIERIYVKNEYHGQGLGKLLFDKAMQVATEKEVKYIWLGVWEKNLKAMKFYKDRGFYKFAEHPFKLGDDLQTDLLMRLDL